MFAYTWAHVHKIVDVDVKPEIISHKAFLSFRVRSIGEIKLKSRDEFEYPYINPKYLSHPDDVQTMIDGYCTYKTLETPLIELHFISFV